MTSHPPHGLLSRARAMTLLVKARLKQHLEPGTSESDDIRQLQHALRVSEQDPRFARMTAAVNLLGEGLSLAPCCPWRDAFPNDISALACLGRSYRQLRAAVTLMMNGYCTEARVILRSVYGNAAVARMLARDPQKAEKWLRKQHWYPDREVRSWFSDA